SHYSQLSVAFVGWTKLLFFFMKNVLYFSTSASKAQFFRLFQKSTFFVFLIAVFGAMELKSQCTSCAYPQFYEVGSGLPIPVTNMAAAISKYGPGFSSFSKACVRLVGVFEIDAAWSVDSTQFYAVGTSSTLRVTSSGNFTALNSTFFPCNSPTPGSWQGIQVLLNGTITINNSSINYANIGIDIQDKCNFFVTHNGFYFCNKGMEIKGTQVTTTPPMHTIDDNLFYDDGWGIYFSGAKNVDCKANLYNRTLNIPVNMVGIELARHPVSSANCENITITGGTFLNQAFGLKSRYTRNLSLSSATFTDCTEGILFRDGSKGLSVLNNTLTNTRLFSIELRQQSTNQGNAHINGNHVFAGGTTVRSMLRVTDFTGTGKATINNNIVTLPTVGPTGQNGIEVFGNIAMGGLEIDSNIVSYSVGTCGGIQVDKSYTNCVISNNKVNGAGAGMPFHIKTSNCGQSPDNPNLPLPNLDIVGNIVGTGVSVGTLRGISIENCSANLLLCCNNLTNSMTGLYITGPLNGAEIHTTTFGNHPFAGLHYDQVFSTGALQFLHGNDWSAALGMWHAKFDGSNGVAMITKYTVSDALLPNGLAKISVNNNPLLASLWFAVTPTTELTCANGAVCDGYETGEKGERSETQQVAESITVYPNPADELLTIALPQHEEDTQVSLLDLTGKILLQETYSPETGVANIRTGHLPDGIYLIQCIWPNHKAIAQKVVIRH
ncbi:MAG: right-handed parallel beta-helix repeat-containing protein, partial [Saprospiraceae bacterium]